MHAPAAPGGSAHVPKRHDRVPRRASGNVGASAAAAGDGVDGFEAPGIEKGEGRCRGNAHVVYAD